MLPCDGVYPLEEQWRIFGVGTGTPESKNPDAAFLGFRKSRHERRPRPEGVFAERGSVGSHRILLDSADRIGSPPVGPASVPVHPLRPGDPTR